MSESSITAYASAIASVARAEGIARVVEDELFRVARALGANDELRASLADASIPLERRTSIIEDLLGGKATTTTVSVVTLLVANDRVGQLAAIVDEFVSQSAGARGEAVAEVRSAVPLSDDQKARLAAALKAQTQLDVTIRNVIDPTVIGGIVTQIGDTLLDGSVRSRLTQLREAF